MYPRLKLARNLLREDGVIFISIDDDEVEQPAAALRRNLRRGKLRCHIVWQKRYIRGAISEMHLGARHDYVLVYARESTSCARGYRLLRTHG